MNNSEAKPKKILLVEDDRNIARALAIRLKHEGYVTTIAPDALSAVETAMKSDPDLALLDISLPAGNGFTVAERFQALLPKTTPLIFLTASKQPGLREKAHELGAAAFFQKPYKSEAILEAVKLALSGSTVRPEPAVYVIPDV